MFKDILIGKHVRVIRSYDQTLVSKSGKIVDESRGMLKVRMEGGDQRIISIPKRICFLEFYSQRGAISIDGRDLIGTAVERIHRP